MAKYVGTMHWENLEGGVWFLECDDGNRFAVKQLAKEFQVEGLRLELEAEESHEFSFFMVGTFLVVKSARRL